jgi:hypothetical protein
MGAKIGGDWWDLTSSYIITNLIIPSEHRVVISLEYDVSTALVAMFPSRDAVLQCGTIRIKQAMYCLFDTKLLCNYCSGSLVIR